ncbi:MAG: AmmeMemoRadiSam system protein A [Actinomycetota bacterium]
MDRSHGELTAQELGLLVDVAVESVRQAVAEGRRWVPDPADHPEALRRLGATFVTLRRAGALRGCIGTLEATEPLVVAVADRARAAALADPRFLPVEPRELADLEVSVSVLSLMQPVPVGSWQELLEVLRPGVDGLVVEAGYHRATFLPSVWEELPGKEMFLDALWRKAGLPPRAWPAHIAISRYTAQHAGGGHP